MVRIADDFAAIKAGLAQLTGADKPLRGEAWSEGDLYTVVAAAVKAGATKLRVSPRPYFMNRTLEVPAGFHLNLDGSVLISTLGFRGPVLFSVLGGATLSFKYGFADLTHVPDTGRSSRFEE